MTSKEYFLPLKRTDYFLYCGEKTNIRELVEKQRLRPRGRRALLLIFTEWHFQRLIAQTFVATFDIYVKYMYTKLNHKWNQSIHHSLTLHAVHVACFSFLFFFLSRVDIVFWKRIRKKKKRIHERDRSCVFRKHARSSIKKEEDNLFTHLWKRR